MDFHGPTPHPFTPGTLVTTPDGSGTVVIDSTTPPSQWTALVSLDNTSRVTYRRFKIEDLTLTPKETPVHANYVPGTIAARAINAHPWLSVVYPEFEDTDFLISPPWPAPIGDRPSGYVEGRATWSHAGDGTVNYQVALAYEGPDGTVEDEITAEVTPGPGAWLDLARPVAELMDRLHTEAHTGVFA